MVRRAFPRKRPGLAAGPALFMITVKMRAYRTHFYHGKIFTTIMEITAIRREWPVVIWVICEHGMPAAVGFAANAAGATRVGVAPGGRKRYRTTGGAIPVVSRIEDGG